MNKLMPARQKQVLPDMVSITILGENQCGLPDLLAEHGLSLWIEYQGHKVLYDTGQSGNVVWNASRLGIDLQKTEAIVFSHGHYDHTGGLESVLALAGTPLLYVHPKALGRKFISVEGGAPREIGMAKSTMAAVRRQREIIWTRQPTEVFPGLRVTGQIPRQCEFEHPTTSFYQDAQCHIPDLLLDDQALYFNTTGGMVVVLGCAHAGVVNTLTYIREMTGQGKIAAVIGGMHLHASEEVQITKTIHILEKMGTDLVVPLHCTGARAISLLQQAFGKRCLLRGVGSHLLL